VDVLHVEMPLPTFVGLMMVLRSFELIDEKPRPLAVLPTAEQVRDISSKDVVTLFREMNPDSTLCGHHNPPHLYDCRDPSL